MYNVIIVDDEHIVQLALKALIDWGSLNCNIVSICSNGEEAIEVLQRQTIDLVLTDINMPKMNGLELIKWIKGSNQDKREANSQETGVIVLSAYNDYEYVRKAFVMGVEDYILKSDMDPEVLSIMVKKILNKKSEGKYNDVQSSDEVSQTSSSKELILEAIIENRFGVDASNLNQYFHSDELDKSFNCLVFLVDDFINVSNRYDDEEIFEFIQHIINTITSRLPQDVSQYIVVRSANKYCLIIEKKAVSQKDNRYELNTFLRRLQKSFETYMDITVTIGVMDEGVTLTKLSQGYKKAERIAGLRYVYGKNRIIYPEDAAFIKKVESHSVIGQTEVLVQSIKELNISKAEKELSDLLEEISTYHNLKLSDLFGYYLELLVSIITELRNTGNDLMNAFDHNTDFPHIIKQFETKDELHSWFLNLVKNMMTYISDNEMDESAFSIRKAKKYLEEHFTEEITLTTIADEVELSESYFSSLFVKETGESFIQYLTRLRIRHSAELLKTTNLKVYEVADKVAYDNTEHFSRVFKKIMGLSPNQYRNQ